LHLFANETSLVKRDSTVGRYFRHRTCISISVEIGTTKHVATDNAHQLPGVFSRVQSSKPSLPSVALWFIDNHVCCRQRQPVARTIPPVVDAATSPPVFVAGFRSAAALPQTPGQSFSLVTFVRCYCLYVLVKSSSP